MRSYLLCHDGWYVLIRIVAGYFLGVTLGLGCPSLSGTATLFGTHLSLIFLQIIYQLKTGVKHDKSFILGFDRTLLDSYDADFGLEETYMHYGLI